MLCLEEEVHPGRFASIARGVFFGANVLKLKPKYGVQQILHIVLVADVQSWSILVSRPELTNRKMEAITNASYPRDDILLSL